MSPAAEATAPQTAPEQPPAPAPCEAAASFPASPIWDHMQAVRLKCPDDQEDPDGADGPDAPDATPGFQQLTHMIGVAADLAAAQTRMRRDKAADYFTYWHHRHADHERALIKDDKGKYVRGWWEKPRYDGTEYAHAGEPVPPPPFPELAEPPEAQPELYLVAAPVFDPDPIVRPYVDHTPVSVFQPLSGRQEAALNAFLGGDSEDPATAHLRAVQEPADDDGADCGEVP